MVKKESTSEAGSPTLGVGRRFLTLAVSRLDMHYGPKLSLALPLWTKAANADAVAALK